MSPLLEGRYGCKTATEQEPFDASKRHESLGKAVIASNPSQGAVSLPLDCGDGVYFFLFFFLGYRGDVYSRQATASHQGHQTNLRYAGTTT